VTDNIVWHEGAVTRAGRPSRGATVWFTGLSGSGKSTVAVEVERAVVAAGRAAYLLDGDNVRLAALRSAHHQPEIRTSSLRRKISYFDVEYPRARGIRLIEHCRDPAGAAIQNEGHLM
jgi:adenylylsulfate kinase-like enzyme